MFTGLFHSGKKAKIAEIGDIHGQMIGIKQRQAQQEELGKRKIVFQKVCILLKLLNNL